MSNSKYRENVWFCLGVAALATSGAAGLLWLLGTLIDASLPPYITFYPAVVLSALVAGTRAGLFATLLSGVAVDYFFLTPVYSFGASKPAEITSLTIFFTINVMMSVVAGKLTEIRKRAQTSAAELREVVRLLDLANVMVLDLDHHIVRWNAGCCELFGFMSNQALGQVREQLLHTRYPVTREQIHASLLAEGRWQGEAIHTTSQGREITTKSEWVLWRDGSGEPKAILVTNSDISALKRAEAALRRSEEQFRVLVEKSSNALLTVNRSGDIVTVNAQAEKLFGYQREELIGKSVEMLVPAPMRARHVAERAQYAVNPQPRPMGMGRDLSAQCKDGSLVPVEVALTPVETEDGMLIITTINDITLRKKAEAAAREATEALAHANEELEHTVEARTRQLRTTVAELEAFCYSLSHDMRAPLRAITGFSEIIGMKFQDRPLGGEGEELLRKIEAAATRMDRLIQDVLIVNRLSKEKLELKNIDVGKLILDIIQERPAWQPPKARVEIDGPLPDVLAHEASLTQCITNLIDNAVKFVPPGCKPWVRIRSGKDGDKVRLWFEDNGIGIPREYRDKLFSLFTRLHGETYEGTGVGLFIVRKAAERMGGSVGVQSEPGSGSRFWLDLRPGARP